MDNVKLTKRANNLADRIFGQLKVIKPYDRDQHSHIIWECQCTCGNTTYVKASELLCNKTKSCGCIIKNQNPFQTHPCHLPREKSKTWKGYEEISGYFWSKINYGAKERDIVVEVTIEDLWNLYIKQNKKCALSNIDIVFAKTSKEQRKHRGTTASLDRIDSKKGYTIENIQWIHKDINVMKQAFDQEYFIDLCSKIAKNMEIKND